MKVDLTRVMQQLEYDRPFKVERINAKGEKETVDMTSKDVILKALLDAPGHLPGSGQQESGEEKFRRYEIAVRVKGANGVCEFSPEEVVLLKKLINNYGYMPAVYGQMSECLNKPVAEAAAA